jgi:hypothetical protein
VSRPRRRPPPDPAVIELPGRLECTDKGQHAAARITSFAVKKEPGEGGKIEFAETPLWDVIAESGPAWGPTFRFRCRRCDRDVQLREETLITLIDGLREARGDRTHITVDISLLPC